LIPLRKTTTVLGETIEFATAGWGRPPVVLVNGAGGPIEGWHKVFTPLSERSQVLAYSRPGIGKSSKPAVPQVGSHLVASLRAVLGDAGLAPPYVLVGHSLGGLIVNQFARLHPSEVASVVFLEAAAPSDVSLLSRHETAIQRFLRRALAIVAPPNPNAESVHVATTVADLERAPPFPPVPLTVVTGARPAMGWATAREALTARLAGQQALARLSPLGTHVMAQASGHFPQLTEPDLVVAVIAKVVRESTFGS
jgi:pimeloyl-ACP methyl ester carboxylesterase